MAHQIVFSMLKIASKIPFLPKLLEKIFCRNNETFLWQGISFPNRVGLAAGLDKDAEVFDMLGYLGFGFVEIGTVTPLPQAGNPKPRLFRLKKDKALLNRMGFNNKGVDFVVEKLKNKKSKIVIGGNIGKNKITSDENAVKDYEICFEKLFNYVDFFVINVSSPNTPNLRKLQQKEPLKKLLSHLQELNSRKINPKPIILKIAPDLSFEEIEEIIEVVLETKISGIAATNTTISRENLLCSENEMEKLGAGGISGKPLKNRSTEIIQYISEKSKGEIFIIGIGGIFSETDAKGKIEAGASLLEIYTGFIYNGISLIQKIKKFLLNDRI